MNKIHQYKKVFQRAEWYISDIFIYIKIKKQIVAYSLELSALFISYKQNKINYA